MLKKTPKPVFWKFIKKSAKILFAVEACLFAGSYYIWYRTNTDRDFRKYVNEKYPFALEYYYQIGELFGETRQRELDTKVWTNFAEKSSSTEKSE